MPMYYETQALSEESISPEQMPEKIQVKFVSVSRSPEKLLATF